MVFMCGGNNGMIVLETKLIPQNQFLFVLFKSYDMCLLLHLGNWHTGTCSHMTACALVSKKCLYTL